VAAGADRADAALGGAGSGRDPDPAEWTALYSIVYEELHRRARYLRSRWPHASLSPTTLVHEAWLKLARTRVGAGASRQDFCRAAAHAMRQVLIDAARRKRAGKRAVCKVELADDQGSHAEAETSAVDVLALHEALDRLAALDARMAQVVEYRFFGGLDVAETAALLDVSAETIARDWRAARAFLGSHLGAELR
jgi:RNA polymerase sigma factor (TIGR02999 family)